MNHKHTEAVRFTHAATAEPVHVELAFLKQGEIQIELVRDILPLPLCSAVPTANCMQTLNRCFTG